MALMSNEHRAELERQKQEAQRVYDARNEAPTAVPSNSATIESRGGASTGGEEVKVQPASKLVDASTRSAKQAAPGRAAQGRN